MYNFLSLIILVFIQTQRAKFLLDYYLKILQDTSHLATHNSLTFLEYEKLMSIIQDFKLGFSKRYGLKKRRILNSNISMFNEQITSFIACFQLYTCILLIITFCRILIFAQTVYFLLQLIYTQVFKQSLMQININLLEKCIFKFFYFVSKNKLNFWLIKYKYP